MDGTTPTLKKGRGGARIGAGRKRRDPESMPPKGRFIYVISEDGAPICKIGIASNIAARHSGLQVGTWRTLVLEAAFRLSDELAALAVERLAHEAVQPFHLRGEWFGVSPDRAKQAIEEAARSVRIEIMELTPAAAFAKSSGK